MKRLWPGKACFSGIIRCISIWNPGLGKTACRQTTFRTYYSRLLFYAFLTKEPVNSLEEMLVVLEQGENPRIARNLGLSREILELFVRHMNAFVLSRLDYKIQNISRLANDPSLSPIERVLTAIRKFERLSASEVATPEQVTEEMTGLLPDKCFTGLLEVTNGMSVDYEKIARILSQGKPLNAVSLKDAAAGGRMMKFEAVVGNPPYQEAIHSDTDNASLSRQLFPYYMIAAMELGAEYVSLITPARWFAGDAQDKSFIKLRNYIREHNHIQKMYYVPDAGALFPNVEIKGGIQYFLSKKDYEGEVEFHREGRTPVKRSLFAEGLDIIISDVDILPILEKVRGKNFQSLMEITTGRNAFGIIGKPSVVNAVSRPEPFEGSVLLRCKSNVIRFMKPEAVKKNVDIFQKYKVFISKSAGNPNSDLKVIGYPYVGEPFSACTDSLIPVGKFDTLEEAENLAKYMKTRFLRFLVQIVKSSQNVTRIVYRFVPMQDFTSASDIDWSQTVEQVEQQLYAKYGLTRQEIACIENTVRGVE